MSTFARATLSVLPMKLIWRVPPGERTATCQWLWGGNSASVSPVATSFKVAPSGNPTSQVCASRDRATRIKPCARTASCGAEAGALDVGTLEAGKLDAGTPHAGILEAGILEAGKPEAGTPDAGILEAGKPDAGTPISDSRAGSRRFCH